MSVPLLVIVAILFTATAFAADATCGLSKFSSTIANGDQTVYGEFPWLAAMEYKMRGSKYIVGMKCGGAVINNRYVLTAAQCLNLNSFELNSVWLGVRKLSEVDTTDVDKVRKYGIAKQIIHENYEQYTSANDIALLKLDRDITFSDYISPICLPVQTEALPNSEAIMTIAGWGQTALCGPTTDLKLQAQLPFYSHSDCKDKWNVPVRSDQICTAAETFQTSCWRDTGVPIMEPRPISLDKQWFAIGVVTSNEGCDTSHPVTHTRVSSYATWIAQAIFDS